MSCIRYFLENEKRKLERGSDGASGYDLHAALSVARDMNPGERWPVRTGLYLEMPFGVEAQIRSRSGLALHQGVIVLNAPGTIDSDYRGEVVVTLINLDRNQVYRLLPGDKIAQIVFAPTMALFALSGHHDSRLNPHNWEPVRVPDRKFLSMTDRDKSGHGSTGR